ncbi:cytochrome b5 [Phycomyces nitens]|nr:cytochrome b5 [Phycomyces nitens]
MATIYTIDQVEKHNTKSDCWVIIHNKVYNITDFSAEHPGGEEVLIDEAGKDATESFEDIGHSDEAREILAKYYVGDLEESAHKVGQTYHGLKAGELPVQEKKGS